MGYATVPAGTFHFVSPWLSHSIVSSVQRFNSDPAEFVTNGEEGMGVYCRSLDISSPGR